MSWNIPFFLLKASLNNQSTTLSRYLSVGVGLLVQQLVEFEHVVTEDRVVEGGPLLLPVDPLKLRIKGRRLSARVGGVKLLISVVNIVAEVLIIILKG